MRLPKAIVLSAILATVNNGFAGERPLITKFVAIKAPTIIMVFPPELAHPNKDGDEEAVAHVVFAVEDTLKCLDPLKPKVMSVYADRIKITTGKVESTLDIYKNGQALGAILVDRTHSPKPVITEDGPSTLQGLLPKAASVYWKAKSCAGDV